MVSLLRRSRALVAVMACVSLALVGCSGATKASSKDTLTIARLEFRETFLPWTGSLARNAYSAIMFDYLLQLDSKTFALRPSLAERWEQSPDGKRITFTLRANVPWQGFNGSVTASDVKYTFEQVMRKDSLAFDAAYYRSIISSIDAPDDRTVVINLTRPDSTFLSTLTTNGSIWIVPQAYVKQVGEQEFDKRPVGSGPYVLKRIGTGGSELDFDAVEKHWRVVPAFKHLVYKIVPEESTRVAMLQNGEVDIAPIAHDSAAQIKGQGSLTIKTIHQGYGTGFLFGGMLQKSDPRRTAASGKDPWTDPRVREAMSIAINRDEIVDKIYHGYASPLNIQLFTPGYDKLPPIEYNPERAKQLLAQAGYPNGFDFKVPTYALSPGTELPLLAEAVAGYWEAIGLHPRLVPTDFAVWRKTWNAGKTQGAVMPFRHPNVQEWQNWLVYVRSDANLPSTDDARLAQLQTDLDTEADAGKRASLYQEFTQEENDTFATIGVALVDNLFAMNTKVVGNWPVPSGAYEIYQEYITKPGQNLPFELAAP